MARSTLLCVFIAVSRHAEAQARFLHPLADSVATVSYDAYRPGECLAAIARARGLIRRAKPSDDVAWQQTFLENDTVLTVERSTARACLAHVTVESVPSQELPNLARLAWFAGDSGRMTTALNRRAQLDTTDAARVNTAQQLLALFLRKTPRDLDFVINSVVPGLSRLTTPDAILTRMQTHVALAYIYDGTSRRPDANTIAQAHVDSAVALFERLPADMKAAQVDTIGPLFQTGASEATELGDTVRAHALILTARRVLAKVPDGSDYIHNAEAVVRYFGMTAPPIHVDRVYGLDTTAARDTASARASGDTTGTHLIAGTAPTGRWPRLGRWTLIMPMPLGSYAAGLLKNLHATVGDSVDIVFLASTRGFWPPLGPFTPEREGEIMYDYLAHHWCLPGVLLVEHRPFHRLPDGRRINDPTITPAIYGNAGLVIDPSGTIRAMIGSGGTIRLDQILVTLMHRYAAKTL